MKYAQLYPAAILFTLIASGCAGTTSERAQDATPLPAAEKDDDTPDSEEIEKLEHELGVSQSKLEIAELTIHGQQVQHEEQLAHAREELKMATAKLKNFVEVELPVRRDRAKLDLRGAEDSAKEAAEELQQIELMYKEQDLADMTAEFVVSRGRRRAERAAKRLVLHASEVASLVDYELPMEQKKLEFALRKASEMLAKAEHEAKLQGTRAKLDLREAKVAVMRAERALHKATLRKAKDTLSSTEEMQAKADREANERGDK
jgi:hypothetical protein